MPTFEEIRKKLFGEDVKEIQTGKRNIEPFPGFSSVAAHDTQIPAAPKKNYIDELLEGIAPAASKSSTSYLDTFLEEIAPAPQPAVKTPVLEAALAHNAALDGPPMLDLSKPNEPDADKRTWFQKGAFEDGYQAGDVLKTATGTVTDAAENAGAGAIGLPEKVIDFFAMLAAANTETAMRNTANDAVLFSALNGKSVEEIPQTYEAMAEDTKQTATELIAKDLYDEQAVAKALISDPVKALTGVDAERDSVLGEKSDALLQSAGQLAAQYGLTLVGVPWFVTSGVSSFGGEAESALRQGATLEEAGVSAAITAGAEILTEKLFGGDLFVNKAGFDVLTDKLTRGIANKFVRKAAKFGLDAAGEGAEEWVSQRIGQFGQWLSYNYDEKGLLETLYSEQALDEALEAFLGGTILGSGMTGIKTVTQNKAQQLQSAPQSNENAQAENGQATQETTAEPKKNYIDEILEWITPTAPSSSTSYIDDILGGSASQKQEKSSTPTFREVLEESLGIRKSENSAAQQAATGTKSALEYVEDILARSTNAPTDPVGVAVEAFKQTGTVTNKQATDVLGNSKAVQTLREQVGLDLPDTAAGRRNAVKKAVVRLAQLQEETGSAQSADLNEQSGVKEQLRSQQDKLNTMRPAAEIRVPTEFAQMDKAGKQNWVVEKLRSTGYKVDRKGFGIIDFAKKRLKAAFKYFDSGSAEEASFEALPYVLENGIEIFSHSDHKGREYRTVTIAAPVVINGKRGNMAVVVKQTDGNHYKVHRVLTPDGSVFQLSEMANEADRADGGVTETGSLATSNGAASLETGVIGDTAAGHRQTQPLVPASNISISEADPNVNTNSGDSPANTESVGAAPSGFDPNSHLQYQYGTLPEGEKPVRPDDLPVSTDGTNRVSQTAVTVKGAKVTTDELADLLTRDVTEKNGMTYIPITNDETVQKAFSRISDEGWEVARGGWHADVRNGKAGADLSATGALLLNHAATAGDRAAWLDILHDYQLLGTNTAQGLQALRILKQLSPSDKLYMAKRSVKKMVEDMKLDADIAIDPDLEAEYNATETDAQRDAVLKKIQKNVAQQLPTTFMEKFTALRYMNMLGNLRTQGRNIVGNLTMKATRAAHNAVAAGIEVLADKVSGGKTGRTRSVTVSKEQKAAAAKDFDGLKDYVLDGGKYNDNMSAADFARGVQEQKQIFKFKPLEGYRKLTNWAMEQGDLVFAKDAYARALAGYLKANGITEADFSKVDPVIMDDARLFAAKEAQEATFRDTNWLSGWVSKIGRRKDTPAVGRLLSEGIMPFRKTPANVLVRAEEYSPLGVVNSVVLSVKAAQKGSDVTATQVINSWAKTLTGTGLFGVGMLLQSLGLLSTGPDEDEQKEDFEDFNGWQNYALTLPDGTNLTVDCFSPSAIPVLMGAQLMKQVHENGFQLKDIEKALTSIADPLVEMSMLQGVNDSLENIQYADSNLGQFAINAAVSYLTQGLTNTLAGQLERSFESSRMQTYVDKDSNLPTWLQRTLGKASAKTPGLDYNQIPYINAWGEEEKNPPTGLSLIYNLLSPSYFDKGKDDDLTRELNRLNSAQGDINVYPSAPDKTLTVNKKDYNLSADEYVALAKLQGKTQKQLVEKLIASSDYASLSDEGKASAIRYAYDYARDSARGEVISDHPGITTKWMKEMKGDIAEGILRHIAADDKYTSLSISDASYIDDLLNGLTIQTDKVSAIAGSKLSEKDQKAVLKDTLDDASYAKYLRVLALGLDTDDYASSYGTFREEKDRGGKGTKERTIEQFCDDFNMTYSEAKKLYEIYSPPAGK